MTTHIDPVKQRADFIGWRFPNFPADKIAQAWVDDETDELAADGHTASARVLVDDLALLLDMIPNRVEEGNVADAVWMAKNARVALVRLVRGLRL